MSDYTEREDTKIVKLKGKLSELSTIYKKFKQAYSHLNAGEMETEVLECDQRRKTQKEEIDSVNEQIVLLSGRRSTFSIRESNLKDCLDLTKKNQQKKGLAERFRSLKTEIKSLVGGELSNGDLAKEKVGFETSKLNVQKMYNTGTASMVR